MHMPEYIEVSTTVHLGTGLVILGGGSTDNNPCNRTKNYNFTIYTFLPR